MSMCIRSFKLNFEPFNFELVFFLNAINVLFPHDWFDCQLEKEEEEDGKKNNRFNRIKSTE